MLKINLCSLTHNLIYPTYKVPFAIQGLFIQHKDVHSYDTRNKHDIHFNHMSTITYGKKTISYKAGDVLKNRLFQHIIDTAVVFNFAATLKCGTKASIIFCSVSIIPLETFCNIFMFFLCFMHVVLLTIALIGLAVLYGALMCRFL